MRITIFQSRGKTDISFSYWFNPTKYIVVLQMLFYFVFDYRKIWNIRGKNFYHSLFKIILDSKTSFNIFPITLIFIFTALIIISYRIILYMWLSFLYRYYIGRNKNIILKDQTIFIYLAKCQEQLITFLSFLTRYDIIFRN